MPLWAAAAALNVAAGLVLATHPQRAEDLETVRRWAARWLFDGVNLYASPLSGTDYPPHAIAALSPLALMPAAAAAPAWAAFNLLLAIAAPFLAVRVIRPGTPRADTICLAILFLGWSGSKAFLQFTLLTLVFGLAAMALAERRPRWSGVSLGLAMMKPQIGLPFLLWALFARRWIPVVVSLLTIAAGSLLWCARAGADPVHVAVRYLQILDVYYARPGSMVGIAQAGPLIERLMAGPVGRWVTTGLSMGLLALVCAEASRATRGPVLFYATPALAGVWSLVTFYHLTYGFVLLLPLAVVLLLADPPTEWRLRHAIFWSLQVALVVDVPGLSRRLAPALFNVAPTAGLLQDWYRIVMLVLFASVWLLIRHLQRTQRHNCMTTL